MRGGAGNSEKPEAGELGVLPYAGAGGKSGGRCRAEAEFAADAELAAEGIGGSIADGGGSEGSEGKFCDGTGSMDCRCGATDDPVVCESSFRLISRIPTALIPGFEAIFAICDWLCCSSAAKIEREL